MKNAAFIGLLILAVGCGGKNEVPKTPLSREKFEQVLAGSLLIQARLGHEIRVDIRSDSPAASYYEDLFKEQGVTEADFRTTYDAYLKHPEALKKIYEDVLNQLQQRADSVSH